MTGSKNAGLADLIWGALWGFKTDSPIFYSVSCLSDFFLFLFLFFSVNAIFVLPICPMSASGYHFWALLLYSRVLLSSGEEVLHTTLVLWFSHLVTWFLQLPPGKDLWSPGQGGLHSWVTQDCNNYRDSSWKTTISRASHSVWNTLPLFLYKRLFACLGTSALGISNRSGTHLDGEQVLSKMQPGHTIFALPPVWLQFISNSQEGA